MATDSPRPPPIEWNEQRITILVFHATFHA